MAAPASASNIANLNSDSPRPTPRNDGGVTYPRALAENEMRWLQGPKPVDESGVRELRSLVSSAPSSEPLATAPLIACAVYPGLAWNLTLALIPESDREETLARLVRLPWFRHGRMSKWLREFLVEKVTPEEWDQVVSLLREFLAFKGIPEPGKTGSLGFVKREITADLKVQNQPVTHD